MHAAAVHGLAVSCEAIDHARIALKRLGLIGKGKERDRRPTREEISRLLTYLNGNPRQTIPVGRIMLIAIATGLRLDEISRVQWEDVNEGERTILIRNRKHPRDKRTNNQTIALVTDTGFNPFALKAEQACSSRTLQDRTGNQPISRDDYDLTLAYLPPCRATPPVTMRRSHQPWRLSSSVPQPAKKVFVRGPSTSEMDRSRCDI